MFDGVDIESTFHVMVDGAASWTKPERIREVVTVPGRNGALIYDNGAFNNVEISYNLLIRKEWITEYEAFCSWLYSHKGYFRLEDPVRHPDVYRMAEFAGPLDPNLIFHNEVGTVEIVFNCKPQQFLVSGEVPQITTVPLYCLGRLEIVEGFPEYVDDPSGKSLATLIIKKAGGVSTLKTYFEVFNKGTTYHEYKFALEWLTDSGVHSAYEEGPITINTGNSHVLTDTASDATITGVRISVYCNGGLDDAEILFKCNYKNNEWLHEETFKPSEFYKVLNNPHQYEAAPLITITNPVDAIVCINDYTLTFSDSIPAASITIDADLEDAYTIADGEVINLNPYVTIENSDERELRDFPYLKSGENVWYATKPPTVRVAGDEMETEVSITPRWWRI